MRSLAVLSLVLFACDSTEPAKPVAPAPSAPPAAPAPAVVASAGIPVTKDGVVDQADSILALGSPSIVRVLDPGQEPRTQLRYALAAGAKQSADMHMVMEVEMRAKGNDLPKQNVPELILRLDLATAAGGHVDGTLSKITLEPKNDAEKALAKQMTPALAGLQGLKLGFTVTPEGRVRDVKIAPGAQVDSAALQMLNQMTTSLDSMVVPLPTEPVGVGAVWQVIGRLKAGADMLQYSKLTLKKKDGNVIELVTEVTQLAASRDMVVPGSNATGKLDEFKSGGTGSIRADLGKLVPEQARANVHGRVASTVPGVGAMLVTTGLELTFSPVKAP